MKTKHTPGPWTVKIGTELVIASARDTVLLIGDNRRLIPIDADARLIGAAPDLLAALKHCLLIAEVQEHPAIGLMAREAIAKAEGRDA